MKIKIKYIVKWFLMLFPMILFFILYLKMGDELFVFEDYFLKNAFMGFMADTAECCGSLFDPLARLVGLFIAPEYFSQHSLFWFFEEQIPCFNFRASIIFCFCWLILVWILWELLELISHFWHKITRMEEE